MTRPWINRALDLPHTWRMNARGVPMRSPSLSDEFRTLRTRLESSRMIDRTDQARVLACAPEYPPREVMERLAWILALHFNRPDPSCGRRFE